MFENVVWASLLITLTNILIKSPSTSTESLYNSPKSPEEAAALCPPGDGGLIYHAQLVTDSWTSKKDTNSAGEIKPRRPTLPTREQDFFSSLVQTPDGRWLFSGRLNGWPGLTTLEVRSITALSYVGERLSASEPFE